MFDFLSIPYGFQNVLKIVKKITGAIQEQIDE